MESFSLKEYLDKTGLILSVDKPFGWTSFDVINKVRIYLKYQHGIPKAKVGHAGTLDPLATGLLLICAGKATRQITTLQDLSKTYTGTFRLGATTPSFDAETAISEELPTQHITHEMMLEAARSLTGPIMQEPPLFSAIKLDGKRAYTLARKNQDVVLASRPVHIEDFQITSVQDDMAGFSITCSKGTYIRAIARDFGRLLLSCAYLTELRRTRIGSYEVGSAISVEELDKVFSVTHLPSGD